MEDFINYLTENFGESAEKLAKTSEDNSLFDFDLHMINLVELPRLCRSRGFLDLFFCATCLFGVF